MNFLENIYFFSGLSAAIQAVILLIIAFIAAAIARAVVKKVLEKVLNRKKDGETVAEVTEAKTSLVNIIGNLVYAIVFLLFLPGALQKLGVDSVATPLTSMATRFLNFLPNIIAAVLVIIFGLFLARLAEQLLKIVLKKTKIDSLQEKYVSSADEKSAFSTIIAKIVYVLILIVFVVAALQVLHLEGVAQPATEMLSIIITFIPRLFAAVIVILVGIFLARLVGGLLDGVLKSAGLDEKTSKIMPKNAEGKAVLSVSNLCSVIVKVLIVVFFVVSGINILGVETLTIIGTAIIGYLPNILAAVIILIVAWILAAKASEAILKTNEDSSELALAAKVAIFVLAAFMALTQLGIGSHIISILFTAIVIAIAVAFAIAFGVGGRGWAGKKLEEFDEKIKKSAKKTKKDEE